MMIIFIVKTIYNTFNKDIILSVCVRKNYIVSQRLISTCVVCVLYLIIIIIIRKKKLLYFPCGDAYDDVKCFQIYFFIYFYFSSHLLHQFFYSWKSPVPSVHICVCLLKSVCVFSSCFKFTSQYCKKVLILHGKFFLYCFYDVHICECECYFHTKHNTSLICCYNLHHIFNILEKV